MSTWAIAGMLGAKSRWALRTPPCEMGDEETAEMKECSTAGWHSCVVVYTRLRVDLVWHVAVATQSAGDEVHFYGVDVLGSWS